MRFIRDRGVLGLEIRAFEVHLGRVNRTGSGEVGNKPECVAVGAPHRIFFSSLGSKDQTGRTVPFGVPHVQIVARDQGHGFAIWGQCGLRGFSRKAFDGVGHGVAWCGDCQRGDGGGFPIEIDSMQLIPAVRNGNFAIRGQRPVVDIHFGKRCDLGGLAAALGLPPEIDRPVGGIGQIQHMALSVAGWPSVIPRPRRELGEGAIGGQTPHIGAFCTSEMTAGPAVVVPATHKEHLPVFTGNRSRAKGVMQAHGVAALAGDHVRPLRAVYVKFKVGGEPDLFFGDRAERYRPVQRGELADTRSVCSHAPQVPNPIAIGFENNFGTVGAPSTSGFIGRVGGQPLGVPARRGHRPEIAPPTEADAVSVGAQAGEAWEINGGLGQGCGQQCAEHIYLLGMKRLGISADVGRWKTDEGQLRAPLSLTCFMPRRRSRNRRDLPTRSRR